MKVTYEFNTADDSFDVCEYEQIKHANDMAAALRDLSCQVRGWCDPCEYSRYPIPHR